MRKDLFAVGTKEVLFSCLIGCSGQKEDRLQETIRTLNNELKRLKTAMHNLDTAQSKLNDCSTDIHGLSLLLSTDHSAKAQLDQVRKTLSFYRKVQDLCDYFKKGIFADVHQLQENISSVRAAIGYFSSLTSLEARDYLSRYRDCLNGVVPLLLDQIKVNPDSAIYTRLFSEATHGIKEYPLQTDFRFDKELDQVLRFLYEKCKAMSNDEQVDYLTDCLPFHFKKPEK